MTAATDDFAGASYGLVAPYKHAASISPDDTNELSNVTRAIYVGGNGNIVLITLAGETVPFIGVVVGTFLPVRARQVKLTSTTATNLIALW
ncbi:hypothetical protein BH10PLA2_BH10PLA2_00550 [soil metagenome]